jgi:Flp pilus assembly protein CpaB
MKMKSGLSLTLVAIVSGFVAAILVMVYLQQIENKYRKAAIKPEPAKATVVVPKSDLKKGTLLDANNVAAREVPEIYLPSNVILAKDFNLILNRTLLNPVERGRPLTWEAVTGKAIKTFSENVELGRRAKSIRVNKIDSFDGLLRPGDRIDLVGRFTREQVGLDAGDENIPDNVVLPVLQNVEVLSAGKEDLYGRKYELTQTNSTDGFNMEFSVINLNLTPYQIAKVELAETLGQLTAVLRHPKDSSTYTFQFMGVEQLLMPEPTETVDIVLDDEGKPVGRIIGDNVVDSDGNIIGQVVDGKAVGLDGRQLGQVVTGVSADDPVMRITEVADVVRDADGNIIGKVVDGKIIDQQGNVVGRVEDGQAIGLDGVRLGNIEKDVALDAQGNEVQSQTNKVAEYADVVKDENGNIIGKVVNGQIIDGDGNVLGKVENGQAVGLDGTLLGDIEQAVALDSNGNEVLDTGPQIVEEQVVRDADGNVLGTLHGDKVIDADGNLVGVIKDGKVIDNNGNTVADAVEINKQRTAITEPQIVRDENGNIIGQRIGNRVVDASGNTVGVIQDDKLVDLDGNVIAESVSTEILEDKTGVSGPLTTQALNQFIEFIAGGTAEDGVLPINKLRVE